MLIDLLQMIVAVMVFGCVLFVSLRLQPADSDS